MKKLVVLMMTAALAAGMITGCGGNTSTATSEETVAASAAEAQGDTASPEASEAASESTVSAASESDADEEESSAELKDWEESYAERYEITGDEEQVWGFVSLGFTNTFAQKYTAGLEEYTKAAFPNVTLNVGDGEIDVDKQLQVCENFITQGVDCLAISAVDSDGCVQICKLAQENHVPFVVINSDVNCETEDHFFVGSDHYYSGQLQAEYLIGNVDDTETQKLFYLGGTDGFTHSKLRREGVYETLDQAGYNYEVVSDMEGKYLRDQAMSITEDWVTRYGEDIDIIVAANDEMAMGALQALEAADIHDVVICGIDANTDCVEAVSEGRIAMTVFQDAKSQGKWGAIAMYAAAQGAEPEFLSIPYLPVTKENCAEYAD